MDGRINEEEKEEYHFTSMFEEALLDGVHERRNEQTNECCHFAFPRLALQSPEHVLARAHHG